MAETTLTVTLTCRSPLNIGAGAQSGTLAKRGMLKDQAGWPYIPATTFKGRLRHMVEQIAHTLPLTHPVCRTHQDMCRETPCLVCQLFGSPWQSGRLIFANLELSGPEAALKLRRTGLRPQTSQRMSVTINRRRRVAEDARLFSTELLWPGLDLAFTGTMRGDITPAQAGLLAAGVQLLEAIGQGKTGGLGWVAAATTVHTAERDWSSDDLLQAVSQWRQTS